MFTNDENKKKEDIFKILIRLSDLSQKQLNKILIEKNIDFKSSDFDYIDFFSSFESLYEINLLIDKVQDNKVMNEILKKERKKLKEFDKNELSEILGVNPNLGFSKAQLIDQIINKKRDEDEINNAIFNDENIYELVNPIYNKFFGNLNNYEISPNLKFEVKYYDFLDQIDNDYKEYLLDKEIFDFLLENLDHGFHVEYSLSKSFKNILKTNNLSIEDGRYLLKRILYDYINGDIDSCEKLKDEYIKSIKNIEDLKTHIYKRETQILKLFTRHREDFQRYVDLKEKSSPGKIEKLNNFFNENISKIKKFNNKMLYFNDTYFSSSKRYELIWEYDEIYNQLPSSDLDFFKHQLDNFEDLIQFKEIFEDLYNYEGLADEKSNYIKLANERYIQNELELNKNFFEDIYKTVKAKMTNTVLIGMPGCGKTTVAEILKEETGKPLFDSDVCFFEKEGVTPGDYIKKYGEAKFRIIETEILREISKKSGVIISTGGGAVTRKDNKDILKQNGVLVYIKRDIKKIATEDRPLSKDVEKLYKVRKPMYEAFADFEVNNNKTPRDTAFEILEKIK